MPYRGELVGLDLEISSAGQPVTELDGDEVLSSVPLTVEATATIREPGGGEHQLQITDPVGLAVTTGNGAAVAAGGFTCERLQAQPGAFTYLVGTNSTFDYSHTDEQGAPCCWQATEAVIASIVAEVEVDDGQGGSVRITDSAEIWVESTPRPADPCTVRAMEDGVPDIASYNGYGLIDVGTVYLTDACGNLVHGVGEHDSEWHDQPGDDVRVTSPLEPPVGEGVWARGRSDGSAHQWSYGLELVGTVGEPDSIPDGAYTIELEVQSQSPECSAGGVITGSYTVSTTQGAPQVVLWWDPNEHRGTDPEGTVVSPGSAVRDETTGEIAVWRVPAFADQWADQLFEGGYSDVPVKVYLAWYGSIPFDEDGGLDPSYLEPIQGVELCSGTVEKLTDASGHIHSDSEVRTTCDTTWDTEATIMASSDPEDTAENPAGLPDSWVQVGTGVGITRGPDQPGRYLLVAEPEDEAFRRGDAWKVMNDLLPDGFVEVVVGGGMFLDEDWEPVDPFSVQEPVPAILLMDAEVVDQANPSVLISTFTGDGEVLASGIPVSMVPAEGGVEFVGNITLYPDGYVATKTESSPRVDVPLGIGSIEAHSVSSKAAAAPLAVAKSAFPGELRLFFLTRDGSQLTPNGGSEQQTEISLASPDNYAEIVWLRVTAINPHRPSDSPQKVNLPVGIVEIENTNYTAETNQFFDGINPHLTLLDSTGKIGWPGNLDYILMKSGIIDVPIASNAVTRLMNQTGTVVPPPYDGANGALLKPVPDPSAIGKPITPNEGEILQIAQWVDERNYVSRPADPNLGWQDNPNSVRDWLEAKVWEFYSFPNNPYLTSTEARDALSILENVAEDLTLNSYARVQGSKSDAQLHRTIQWNPVQRGVRNPASFNLQPPVVGVPMVQSGYVTMALPPVVPVFYISAVHELRHVWQYALTWDIDFALPDSDPAGVGFPNGDFLPDCCEPESASSLADSAFSEDGGRNTDFQFNGETVRDSGTISDAIERDAIRFAYGNILSSLNNPDLLSCVIESPTAFNTPLNQQLDVETFLRLQVVVPWSWLDTGTGNIKSGYIRAAPVHWWVDSGHCVFVDWDSRLTHIVEPTHFPEDPQNPDTTEWFSQVSLWSDVPGHCVITAQMGSPQPPAPEDCPAPPALTFTVDVVSN